MEVAAAAVVSHKWPHSDSTLCCLPEVCKVLERLRNLEVSS